jgi:hypothetical protein
MKFIHPFGATEFLANVLSVFKIFTGDPPDWSIIKSRKKKKYTKTDNLTKYS